MTSCALLRYPLLFGFFIVAFKSAKNTKRKMTAPALNFKSIFSYGISGLLSCLFLWGIISAGIGLICPVDAVDLDFPLKNGTFSIIHGGSNISINHHRIVAAQKLALDIVQINHLGTRTKCWNPKKMEDFNIFCSNVYSPCNGVIVEALDQYPDLEPLQMDPENPGGNYIAIAVEEQNNVVILAHLKKGTIQVKKGDSVQKGQFLAKVGNSGNTTEPHLHIHCVKKNSLDFFFSGKPVPMKFNDRFLTRNDIIKNSF